MDSRKLRSTHARVTAGSTAVVAFILIAGCSSLSPPATPSATFVLREPAAAFTATGRVAARVTGDGTRGFSGGFSWVHRQTGDTVELLTPLGQVAARMRLTPAGATIEMGDGRVTETADAEKFLSDAFGVPLPLTALPNWFQGVPLAGVAYRAEADSLGRPVTIWQNGWQIQYTAYADETASARPARVQLNQDNVEARMIISEWSAP